LFKDLREAPEGKCILGIGGVRMPAGIGTIVIQITNNKGETSVIELENVFYVPDVPKNLISISQWSKEYKDNCGILSRGTYSIFMWEQDANQKLVPHPVNCRIPMMQVNEGGPNPMEAFTAEHINCLHDNINMIAAGAEKINPYVGVSRRRDDDDQSELEEPEVAQQPTYDTSYPAGLTVKYKRKNKVILASVLGTTEGDGGTREDPMCKIRILNTTVELTVPVSTLSPCTTPDPADVPMHMSEIDPNALEHLITKEDLEKL
jgi:hypothetical protein